MYWLQVYAFYAPVAFPPGQEILLTPIASDQPEAIVANDVTGIDADSSPIRFRACFTTPLSLSMLSESYKPYTDPVPLNGPGWFDCYNAGEIDGALEKGEALAFLSQAEIHPGVDRVVAVFPDGRAFAWHQINACGDAQFNQRDLPAGCPPVSEDQ
ncbi:DUF6446 family protein [Pseudogemmobacter faecipullorum]|uniref:Histidine kinase n=1 Tax=Pseudogemmobacter faecipullorum TaxID=2755041 RepID=A0ABS8CMG4_9RHOB|nr:DUF6446 family protein [Pseudogemmobacter faecipullorum]MCB5410571.1 histidine kinase [Pseudogemmobacter faecipullorum]